MTATAPSDAMTQVFVPVPVRGEGFGAVTSCSLIFAPFAILSAGLLFPACSCTSSPFCRAACSDGPP